MTRPTLALAGALSASLLLGPVAAAAHALLRHATPGAGATLHGAPAQLVLQFSEGVETAFSAITVTDAAGTHFEQGKPQVVGGDPTHVAVALRSLPTGVYTVSWHATSVDTHKTEGSYQFTVAP